MIQAFQIRKIIVPTSLPQQDDNIIAWAEQLSNVFKAQLVLYNAVNPSAEDSHDQNIQASISNQFLKTAMIGLVKLGKTIQSVYKIRYLVEVSSNWRNLIRQVQDEHAHLLVTGMPAIGTRTPGQLTALMYNCPCPILFVRKTNQPLIPAKILVPVRLTDGLEQKLPAVIAWAKSCGATVCLSAFAPDTAPAKDNLHLQYLLEKMKNTLKMAGIKVESETAHGHHFGTAMVQRAQLTGADLIAIAVEPSNYMAQLFTKMVGPYFLENSPVPLLSIPLIHTASNSSNVDQLVSTNPITADVPLRTSAYQ